jgi:alpha-N-arabinofuranosidase
MKCETLVATAIAWAMASASALASPAEAPVATAVLATEPSGPVISRDIFGQFAEHLGEGIYGGIWVGKDSPIPNVRGIRSDVVAALRAIKVPVVRWPGGCFADEYHWRNGIGPASQRATTVNANWGNVIEPNSFGTDEFMDFVDQIGSEAYINVNIATGTPQEAADWLEYMTTDLPTTLGKKRVENGHAKPYRIKYMGVGNESWGCGGNMSAENYVERLKLFTTFVHNLNPEQGSPMRYVRGPNAMQRIAVGPEDNNIEYTEAAMKAWQSSRPWRWGFEGLSLHFYTMGSTPMSSPATDFGEKDYVDFVKQTLSIDDMISTNAAIMDKYDPDKKVALVVDEWSAWLKPMPGTNPRFLKQQNSLRDAILASLNLNIFARHADRVRMANIAQMANVLQSMVLTEGEKMLLTPTYHTYKMHVPFQDAQLIPLSFNAGTYTYAGTALPQMDAIAARAKDGKIWIAATNIDPKHSVNFTLKLQDRAVKVATGRILTARSIDSINTFEATDTVSPKPFRAQVTSGMLVLKLPPKSLVVVSLD